MCQLCQKVTGITLSLKITFEMSPLTIKLENILMIFNSNRFLAKRQGIVSQIQKNMIEDTRLNMILFLRQENLISRLSSKPTHLPILVLRKEMQVVLHGFT